MHAAGLPTDESITIYAHRGRPVLRAIAYADALVAPIFTCPVSAGDPLPVVEYIDGRIDLNKHLIKNYASTFFVRVSGDSMIGAGIHDGDILVVDRSKEAVHQSVVIARVDDEFLVKRLIERDGRVLLAPENDDYEELEIAEHHDFEIWGVVTSVIHPL